MKHAVHRLQVTRLKRIEGQVNGVVRMVEAGRYCMDILIQLRAASAALKKVEEQVLREHLNHCLAGVARRGAEKEFQKKLDELFEVFGPFGH